MTNIYGDGYEEATEPGPDVELEWYNGHWEKRLNKLAPFVRWYKYRRPIKLRVGERYRCRNEDIVEVVDLGRTAFPYKAIIVVNASRSIDCGGLSSYKENGAFCFSASPYDIIEHIPKQPKEKPMKEQSITVNNVTLSFDQVQEAYDKMQKAKAENEIKAGDYILSSDKIIMKVKEINNDIVGGETGRIEYAPTSKKLHLTPEQKAWLDSLIGGVE